jgi:hypothetical protein
MVETTMLIHNSNKTFQSLALWLRIQIKPFSLHSWSLIWGLIHVFTNILYDSRNLDSIWIRINYLSKCRYLNRITSGFFWLAKLGVSVFEFLLVILFLLAISETMEIKNNAILLFSFKCSMQLRGPHRLPISPLNGSIRSGGRHRGRVLDPGTASSSPPETGKLAPWG